MPRRRGWAFGWLGGGRAARVILGPGMAIGLVGAGSGLGFYLGPKFAGWRAETAAWDWGHVTQWQKPLVELGIIGLVVGVLFLLFATEATAGSARADLRKTHPPLG